MYNELLFVLWYRFLVLELNEFRNTSIVSKNKIKGQVNAVKLYV